MLADIPCPKNLTEPYLDKEHVQSSKLLPSSIPEPLRLTVHNAIRVVSAVVSRDLFAEVVKVRRCQRIAIRLKLPKYTLGNS